MLTDRQRELRRRGVGASEVAAVVGQNPWRGPHDVWLDKVGLAPERGDSPYSLWGRYVEPAIIAAWRDQTGRKPRQLRYTGRNQRTFVHPNKPLCIATPDGLVDDPSPKPRATLEVKSYGWRLSHHWGEPGTDAIPDYYLTQTTWQMAATGRPRCYLAAECERIIGEYVIDYDAELFGILYESVERFWRDYVETRTPPPVDHSDRCREFLAAYYPRPPQKGDLAPRTPEIDGYAQALRDAMHMVEAAESRKTLAENKLKEAIGDRYGVETHIGKVLWYGVGSRTTYSAKALLELAKSLGATDEQIAAAASTTKPFRAFRAYFPKG